MREEKRRIADSLKKRAGRIKGNTACPMKPQEALLFDTISLQSVFTQRGQNPFPEEEGEICSMYPRIRERPLLMR